MLEFDHSVDSEPTRLRDVAVWVFAFIVMLGASVWAGGCDVKAGRTNTLESAPADADTQARTHHDFNVRCKNMRPLELLDCIAHRHGDSQ